MKTRIKKYAVLALLTAGMAAYPCSVSYAVMGEYISNRLENDRQILSAAGQRLRDGKREGEFYITGRDYVPEGTVLETFYGNALEYSNTLEEIDRRDGVLYHTVRFAVKWKEEEPEEAWEPKQEEPEKNEKQHWRLGDTVVRRLAGTAYTFRCIDQNYQSGSTSEKMAALFLCDSVIPANTGSYYGYEKQEDGSYRYVFHPGPVVNFGDTSEYKYSKIRQWLKSQEENFTNAVWVDIGVDQSYMGQTEEGCYSQLREKDLHPYYMGNQQMTDKLFILSVEEALNYKEYLWSFGATPQAGFEENPESQCDSFSKGYWLRTPMGDGFEADTGLVYIVDLVNGNIRPQAGKPMENDREEEADAQTSEKVNEWAVTSSIGVRPAFALPQQG